MEVDNHGRFVALPLHTLTLGVLNWWHKHCIAYYSSFPREFSHPQDVKLNNGKDQSNVLSTTSFRITPLMLLFSASLDFPVLLRAAMPLRYPALSSDKWEASTTITIWTFQHYKLNLRCRRPRIFQSYKQYQYILGHVIGCLTSTL